MSVKSYGVSNFERIREEDLQCPFCLQVVKDPVTPGIQRKMFYIIGPLRTRAICIHTFCKECFDTIRIRSQSCPVCRVQFSVSAPNPKMTSKVKKYVTETFGISTELYYSEDRLTKPTLSNAKILISRGQYKMGIDMIKNPDFKPKEEAFNYFVRFCKENNKFEILEENLSNLDQASFSDAMIFLLEKCFLCGNYEKVNFLIHKYSLRSDGLTFSSLENLALSLVDKSTKPEELNPVRRVVDTYFNGPASFFVKDRIISAIASKYYILKDIKQAEIQFCDVKNPSLFAGDLFIKLFEYHLSKNDKVEVLSAELLLKKMGPNWNTAKAGFINQIEKAKAALNNERSSCRSKTITIGLIALTSIALYYGSLLFSSAKEG